MTKGDNVIRKKKKKKKRKQKRKEILIKTGTLPAKSGALFCSCLKTRLKLDSLPHKSIINLENGGVGGQVSINIIMEKSAGVFIEAAIHVDTE